ncbi:M24 family metallopeptidase [Desertibacillus haloalkaliphilus]|uniref:M24 family metallopeptidase n=1 Tax=Desertibacillus haloalkaliphilus TaxID=1328930 RepID=UPI001C2697BF|nr:M24 family metallopeptidase [Desertibacillus haloalkaliphilus]MBU8908030.1 M24 family metallopeptidase [Desertibacillus haloalkaliphilus]
MFTEEEYQERLKRTKERMDVEGIEVLLVTNPSNMNYLTGYDAWSFYVHQMVIVILEQDQPIWIGRKQDANAAKYTTWLDSKHIAFYTDEYVHSRTRHPMDYIAAYLTKIGVGNRVIGVEMENYYFTAKAFEQLKKGLAHAVFKDVTLLVNYLRMIKSDKEIRYMKNAATIAERAMQTAINTIAEGVRENDVVAAIYQTQISGTLEFGGDYPAIVPLLPSGEKTSAPHITWSDVTYKKNQTVIIELAGCYKRYHAPLARTVTVGFPTKEVKDLAEVVIEGINETLLAIQPGMTCEEVEAVWSQSIAKYGFMKDSRLGYSTGLSYPPDWGEHTASIRKGDKTILQPNMAFHLIPGIWYDDYGVEISESFYVTDTGCEAFADFPRQLFIKK